jgi:hypothetical protein
MDVVRQKPRRRARAPDGASGYSSAGFVVNTPVIRPLTGGSSACDLAPAVPGVGGAGGPSHGEPRGL